MIQLLFIKGGFFQFLPCEKRDNAHVLPRWERISPVLIRLCFSYLDEGGNAIRVGGQVGFHAIRVT